MDHTHSVRFFNRGPSPVVRLVFFSLLSLLLLFVDARYQYLESTRSALSTLIYPLQRLATVPSMLWRGTTDYLVAQNRLTQENAQLREQHAMDAARQQQMQVLQSDIAHLRNLLELQQRVDYQMQLAEIVYTERDIFKHKLFVDKGSKANVQAGQVVMDDRGIVGQITRVHSLLSEVTLVTDKDHEVPVQILRSGLRAIVYGSGDASELTLRYAPVNADIKDDDVLVTSGIDGIYPPGLPVARVSHIERDPAYPFARIRCAPLAGVGSQRYLFILSGQAKAPPRPDEAVVTEKAKKSKRRKL